MPIKSEQERIQMLSSEEFKLKREELTIFPQLYFVIPIHRSLPTFQHKFPQNLALKVLPKSLNEWLEDLEEKKHELDPATLEEITKIRGVNDLTRLGWSPRIQTLENGFASLLTLERNTAGTLYYRVGDSEFESPLIPNSRFTRFSEEKAKAY